MKNQGISMKQMAALLATPSPTGPPVLTTGEVHGK